MAAALVALGSLLQVFIPAASGGPIALFLPPNRGGSTLGDPGLVVQFLVLALPMGVGAAALSADAWRQACGGLLGLVAAALVFIGRPEGWMAGLAALILVVLARVVQVAGHGGRWSDLAPDPGGASLRALLIAGIVISAAVSVSRLTLLYPTHKPVEPLAGTALLTPTTGNPAADRASAIPGTLALIKRHPLGVGPANFRHAFLEVAWTEVPGSPFSLSHQAVHAGNAFLEMTAEAGVPGGVAGSEKAPAAGLGLQKAAEEVSRSLARTGSSFTRAVPRRGPAPHGDAGTPRATALGASGALEELRCIGLAEGFGLSSPSNGREAQHNPRDQASLREDGR